MNTLIVVPARLASTRLPNKMLSDIGGKPLIIRTLESILSSGYKDVIVACDSNKIANTVRQVGITAVITDPELKSGTDRVYAAYKIFDVNNKYKFVINIQGDMPFINPEFIKKVTDIVHTGNYGISTLATPINDDSYLIDSVVKPVVAFGYEPDITNKKIRFGTTGTALYFSRSPVPFGGPYFHHVGIYGFCSESLSKFVSLPQSPLEKMEKLEQLRALENEMTIGVGLIDSDSPISVDTHADLERARRYFSKLEF